MTPAKPAGATPLNDNTATVSIYGTVRRALVKQLDRLARERHWSRAQMVAHCVEQVVRRHEQ